MQEAVVARRRQQRLGSRWPYLCHVMTSCASNTAVRRSSWHLALSSETGAPPWPWSFSHSGTRGLDFSTVATTSRWQFRLSK